MVIDVLVLFSTMEPEDVELLPTVVTGPAAIASVFESLQPSANVAKMAE